MGSPSNRSELLRSTHCLARKLRNKSQMKTLFVSQVHKVIDRVTIMGPWIVFQGKRDWIVSWFKLLQLQSRDDSWKENLRLQYSNISNIPRDWKGSIWYTISPIGRSFYGWQCVWSTHHCIRMLRNMNQMKTLLVTQVH